MTSFKEIEQVNFKFEDVTTYGVKEGKFGGYSISVALDDKSMDRISELAKKHGTKNPLYKRTLYLKSKVLSKNQEKDLLNKGKAHILINFVATGTYTGDDGTYLVFKVTKLRKIDTPESEDECPED